MDFAVDRCAPLTADAPPSQLIQIPHQRDSSKIFTNQTIKMKMKRINESKLHNHDKGFGQFWESQSLPRLSYLA